MSEKLIPNGFRPASLDMSVPVPSKSEELKKEHPPKSLTTEVAKAKTDVSLKINSELVKIMNESRETLKKLKLDSFASEIDNICSEASRSKFSVAVVGEFSRGKSTFINKMFGRKLLPVANMPTTAMLTRIQYTSGKESLTIFDADKKRKKTLPLCISSWDNYIADDDGNDPNGVAFIGINSPWLKNGIEIIDTPGAGDLEAGRAKIIGDAVKSCDGAIITISALSAMSMSERVFIEERLIARKTPFLMLIITKLDQVDLSQRNSIVDYVHEKLKTWNMKGIKVFVPYNIEMPDSRYSTIIGMDKVMDCINSWITNSERKKLTEQWLALKLKSNLQAASDFVNEQKLLACAGSDENRDKLIHQKKQMLDKAEIIWDETNLDIIHRSKECYNLFLTKIAEYKESITEKLQYEVTHTGNLKNWWENDFPYRLKIEMTNMATGIENTVAKQVAKDTAAINGVLMKNFKTSILYSPEDVTNRQVYASADEAESSVQVKDMTKERTISRIGIAALSITAALACTVVGFTPIVATMGLGTGGPIISESIFKKKTEAQQELLKNEIRQRIPRVVDNAMLYSESRVKKIYNDILAEASKQHESWKEAQSAVINSAPEKVSSKDSASFDNTLKILSSLCSKIDSII